MMKRLITYLTLGGLALLTPAWLVAWPAAKPAHEYHVSVTQMQYNPAQKALEISIRVFTDDLEKALSVENNNQRFVVNNNDQNGTYIERYLRKSFVLTDSRQQQRPFQYVGKEQEADATWIYLEVPVPENLAGWTLQNNLMMEVFSDQMNMLNLKLPTGKKTILFKKGQSLHPLR
ncbi:DUF6702 family protein [Telluribacter sp.]|jgi:hypothetical protein|uniref:DUF6702 family protein n=1 Tax=Telluribacter sp. TaxID=1978767 RepID=UPI002E101CDF|nr:DUF6702 family protein [Telluribacter sp.]